MVTGDSAYRLLGHGLSGSALPARWFRSLDAATLRSDRASLEVQPEPDRLVRPLRVYGRPGVDQAAVDIEVPDRTITVEDEPAAVREFEFMTSESTAWRRRRRRSRPAAALVIHHALLHVRCGHWVGDLLGQPALWPACISGIP